MSTYWQVLWWDYPSAQVLTYKNAHTHARTLTHTNNEAQVFLGLAYTLAVCHVSVSRANSRQHTYKKKNKAQKHTVIQPGGWLGACTSPYVCIQISHTLGLLSPGPWMPKWVQGHSACLCAGLCVHDNLPQLLTNWGGI